MNEVQWLWIGVVIVAVLLWWTGEHIYLRGYKRGCEAISEIFYAGKCEGEADHD